MRGVWWSAFALLLLVVATSALRTAQVDGTPRFSRRHQNPDGGPTSTSKSEDVSPTSRSRVSRRREEIQPRNNSRTSRSRSRPTETPVSVTEKTQFQSEHTERFDSRRSRTRSRPVVNEESFDTTINNRKNQATGRSRQSSRFVSSSPTPIPLLITSPTVENIRKDFTDVALNDITKTISKDTSEPNTQIRRRSSTSRTIETITTPRGRGRVNRRTNIRALDLDVAGTANALSTAPKEPTTVRTGDLRNSRKLRYKTRQSEIDTNLTGEGITTSNELKSSQMRENITSQSDLKTFTRFTTEKSIRLTTETVSLKTSTQKNTKVIKRPVGRSKPKSSVTAEKSKVSDEIKEDDNYPETFKALIQAKNASLRSKLNKDANNNDTGTEEEKISIETTQKPEQTKPKSAEYRLRGSYYIPRSKKLNSFTSPSTFSPNTERTYKFQRKVKSTTTETPKNETSIDSKRNELNLSFKKPVIRSSLYLRRNTSKNFNTSSEPSVKDSLKNKEVKSVFRSKQLLPRTSYYSRLRNNGLTTTTTTMGTESSINEITEQIAIAAKKVENTAELPIIFTGGTSKEPDNSNIQGSSNFIITVNSKESSENGTENEVISKPEESEIKPFISSIATTQKYHATYKEKNNDISITDKEKITITPPIRNIRTRKYSRRSSKAKEDTAVVTPKSKERSLRKYSDTFSKTTETSSNGIIVGPDKQKNKFSSKYRASYLDKPFYKPTVPTITPPSTVEGEEIQIGPDVNAISFTKSRSPLTSADLRLSENLAKSLQIMNVEASHHSPSVTVSIFDALAEILTSTPRPHISSTTEVMPKQNPNNDVKQTFVGPQQQTTEEIRISTTFKPFTERSTTTKRSVNDAFTTTQRTQTSRFRITTEIPSTSTFSDEEDILFLQNLKSVLSTTNGGEDPETALANRVIALAVERSLNEIQTGKTGDASTTIRPTSSTTASTTTATSTHPTTRGTTLKTPSIEEDIKQFEQDTKLLQALLKATGQDPSKFNIPTLPSTNTPGAFTIESTTAKPYGAKIAVKDELKNENDDAQLLQTLIKLQDAQETTTQRSKLAITGQSPDEALKKLLNQAQPTGMVSEATKSSISLSTEYGNSNDALLAALLKEQGFGPTTASSLDEQLRLAVSFNFLTFV